MSPKVAKILAYIGPVGWLIAFLAGDKTDEGVKQHLNQALIPAMLSVFGNVVVVGGLFGFVFCVIGLIRAIQDNDEPMPLFGGIQIIK